MKEIANNGKISELIPDDKNFNKHSQYGMHLLEKSVSELGLGRSILVDKNNKIIGGNGIAETAASLGLEDCIIVQTDGSKLVVVKRNDIDLNSKMGRELALADNSTANVNLQWDEETLKAETEAYDICPQDWGADVEMPSPDEIADDMPDENEESRLIVKSKDLTELSKLFSELEEKGFKCEIK